MDNYVEDKMADWGIKHMIETFREWDIHCCLPKKEMRGEVSTTRTQVRHYSSVIMPRAKPTKKRKFYGNKYTRPLKETAKPCASEEKLQYT
ncbi:hypothetical protein LSAT2_016204 [Lamellibrachia satsuma]|nr:hypothetical protein LSAT2_016204 [Lamellibrachia satsuma]